jgi:alkylated DNA repair dioxygenase AlkB
MTNSQLEFFVDDDAWGAIMPTHKRMPGLVVVPDFVTKEQETALLQTIDDQPWRNDLKRRVQHYGYRYDYRARTVTRDSYLGPLPLWGENIAQRLKTEKYMSQVPDQLIVNEYLPGQGISAHVDCVPCFGPVITSLSLGAACVMTFRHPKQQQQLDVILPQRSLAVLTGPARYEWTHEIAARKSDIINGARTSRDRRVSLTFRTVIV